MNESSINFRLSQLTIFKWQIFNSSRMQNCSCQPKMSTMLNYTMSGLYLECWGSTQHYCMTPASAIDRRNIDSQ